MQAAQEATLQAFVDEVLDDARRRGARTARRPDARRPRASADVLVRASADAAALVVGYGEVAGPLTSMAAGCARHARCPVDRRPDPTCRRDPAHPEPRGGSVIEELTDVPPGSTVSVPAAC